MFAFDQRHRKEYLYVIMPSLDWLGKRAVMDHHRQVPYHLLRCDEKLSVGDVGSGNLLVEGDNLLALKALLPYYAGQVKCIYIDPPYNTGNENWVYNDNVNAPEIKKWLGKVVGAESEDLSRHDKWLCMMYPRLCLLREMLSDDGAIFISIDDNEIERLKLILSEIFGATNHVCTLIWKRRTSPDSRNLNGVSADHEYVLCYRKSAGLRFRGALKDLTKYSNPDHDPRGPWMSDNPTGLANARERPNLHYDVVNPITGLRYPPHPSRGWIYGQDKMKELIADGRILWPKKSSGRPRIKRYLTDMKSETTGFSTMLDAPGNVTATKELSEMLGPKVFAFPKPSELIRILVEQATDSSSLILDSFAGSGTTGHAVLALNKADGGNRRFIAIEMEPKIAREVTAQRLMRVSKGYGETEGLGGGFRYCRLAEPLFDETGQIRPEVKFADLAAHVWFTESGEPIPSKPTGKTPFLGVHKETAYYLLFNGVLGDKSVNGGNVLTSRILDRLKDHDGPRIVYGEGCRLSAARLRREKIVFRQVPYEVKVS